MTRGTDTKTSPTSIVQSGPASSGPDPGKRSGTQGPNYTGSAYADHGALCESQPGADGCFLPAKVRDKYIPEITQRIAAVGETYQRACDVVRLERLMTPSTQPSFVVGLLFDIVVGKWTGGIVEHFAALRAAAFQTANALELEVTGVMKLEAATLNAKLATAVAKVKPLAVQSAGSTTTSAAQSFISALKLSAAIGFQTLRESVPATATDAELIGIHEAFDVQYHSQDSYQVAISEKIERYLKSGVTNIGRQSDTSRQGVSTKEDADPYAAVDTRVAWARFTSGYPTRLVYEHASSRDIGGKGAAKFGGADTQHAGATKAGLPGETVDAEAGAHFVPQEFVEVALQRHIAQWGGDPGFVDIDDSAWYWEPARAAAAHQRKRQEQKSSIPVVQSPNMTRLDLKPGMTDEPIVIPDAFKLKDGMP
ncbi:MAG TPA: hypothetical protein VGM94_00850 [Galbitalea sp.]|jgi:hypothetical protein